MLDQVLTLYQFSIIHPSIYIQFGGAKAGQKKKPKNKKQNTTCPLNIRSLCSDCQVLLLVTKVQTNSRAVIVGALLVHLPPRLTIPSPSEMTPRKFKGQHPTFSLFFSSLIFRNQNLKAKAYKGIIIKWPKMLRKSLVKDLRKN